ncbi:hypothetical protein Hanom_Chr14g01255351 [Helianthus anomalus]
MLRSLESWSIEVFASTSYIPSALITMYPVFYLFPLLNHFRQKFHQRFLQPHLPVLQFQQSHRIRLEQQPCVPS